MKLYSKLTILLLAVFLVFGASCTAKEKKVQAAAEEPVDEEAIRIASIAVSQLPDDMQGNILDNMESFKADLAAVMAEESRFFLRVMRRKKPSIKRVITARWKPDTTTI